MYVVLKGHVLYFYKDKEAARLTKMVIDILYPYPLCYTCSKLTSQRLTELRAKQVKKKKEKKERTSSALVILVGLAVLYSARVN